MARLIAVVVGCNYQDSPGGFPLLTSAESDALRMASLLREATFAGGHLAGLTLLLGQQATIPAIEASLQQAQDSKGDEDSVLFYFSGHGAKDAAGGLLLYSWDEPYPAARLIDLLRSSPRATRVILDCCHAGAIDRLPGAVAEVHHSPPPVP